MFKTGINSQLKTYLIPLCFFFILQYMSAIFYHNEEQKSLAEKSLKAVQQSSSRPIQTQILQSTAFYDAEE